MLTTSMSIIAEKYPFPHFQHKPEISHEKLDGWLNWLESKAPWNRVNETFYDQYEFSLLHVNLPIELEDLVSKSTLDEMRLLVAKLFNKNIDQTIDVVAHKLVKGDVIKIHNDFIPGNESHRILLHLNRGWSPNNGGYFMIFSEDNPESVCKVIPPEHGLFHGFEISKDSHHAVSEVHAGERFTVIYSFYESKSN